MMRKSLSVWVGTLAIFLLSMVVVVVVFLFISAMRNPAVDYYDEVVRLNDLRMRPVEHHCVAHLHTHLLESLFTSTRYRCFDTLAEADAFTIELQEKLSSNP